MLLLLAFTNEQKCWTRLGIRVESQVLASLWRISP